MGPMKQNLALNTLATTGKPSDSTRFRDKANEDIFHELSNRLLLKPWKIINEDADRMGIRCFNLMRHVGLRCLMELDELIYPTLVKEFYCNLQFEESELKATFFLRGKSGSLTEESLATILGYVNSSKSIRMFDKIQFEGYSKSRTVLSLTGTNSNVASYANMDFESKLMFHALAHIVTPKFFKQNSANSREIFYLWCIKNGHSLNTPFIVLSHMKAFLNGEIKDIPYAMLITRLAKHLNINLEEETDVVSIGLRNSYHLKYLRDHMGKPEAEESENDETETDERIANLRKRKEIKDAAESTKKKAKGRVKVLATPAKLRRNLRPSKKADVESSTKENPVTLSGDISTERAKEEEVRSKKTSSEESEEEEVEQEAVRKEKGKGKEKVGEEEVVEVQEKEKEVEEEKDVVEEGENMNKEDVVEETAAMDTEEETEADKEAEKSDAHPMDKGIGESSETTIPKPQETPENPYEEEEETEREFIVPLLKGLTTISDQIELTNKRMMDLTNVMAAGFQQADKRSYEMIEAMKQADKRSSEIIEALKQINNTLLSKKSTDADHQKAILGLVSKVSAKVADSTQIKIEKKEKKPFAENAILAERQLQTRILTSAPSHIPSVVYQPPSTSKPSSSAPSQTSQQPQSSKFPSPKPSNTDPSLN